MTKRKVSVKELVTDVRLGLGDTAIMEKYQLTRKMLDAVFDKVLEKGALTRADLQGRSRTIEVTGDEQIVSAYTHRPATSDVPSRTAAENGGQTREAEPSPGISGYLDAMVDKWGGKSPKGKARARPVPPAQLPDSIKPLREAREKPEPRARGRSISDLVGSVLSRWKRKPGPQPTRERQLEHAESLLSEVDHVRTRRADVAATLIQSAFRDDLEIVELLLNRGEDINRRTESGATALTMASWWGNLEVVRLLLGRGADVNIRDNHGRTALMEAARFNHLEVARLLIDNGADVNTRDKGGNSALSLAEEEGHNEMSGLLEQYGAKSGHRRR